jgi:N-methylhydantoinase B
MSTNTQATSAADAVTVEIVRNGLFAVTEEMKTNLMRTAYNLIIYEALDFTVGLFTKEGDSISIGLGLPMFIRGMSETVKAKIRHFGVENIHPGDILVTNDAYTTGSHLNHFTFTMPVFHDGELIGFTCCMAHWLDVGGTLGQITTDIYSEGIQIPIVKYRRKGEVNQDLIDIIGMNVRLTERAMGDLRAQITAITTGERRYLELVQRYGWPAVKSAIDQIMDHSEALARANTRSIPDGVYEAESFMDDDGLEIGARIPIRVKVIVKGDEMTIDFTDVSKQVRGFYNSGFTTGVACAQVAYKCLTTPTDYPVNDGSFRPLEVIVPMGTVISAERPYPMRVWMTFPRPWPRLFRSERLRVITQISCFRTFTESRRKTVGCSSSVSGRSAVAGVPKRAKTVSPRRCASTMAIHTTVRLNNSKRNIRSSWKATACVRTARDLVVSVADWVPRWWCRHCRLSR